MQGQGRPRCHCSEESKGDRRQGDAVDSALLHWKQSVRRKSQGRRQSSPLLHATFVVYFTLGLRGAIVADPAPNPSDEIAKAPDFWEKAKTIATVLASVVIPLVALIVGNQYSAALKERELEGKFVELAVSILKEQPDKQSKNLRDWATQVITKYSRVPLSPELTSDLINTTPLPGASAAVRDVQSMLLALGYYSGPTDGQIGPALRAAVKDFQLANGLPADGIMGAQTVSVMIEKYSTAKKKSAN